MESFNKQKLSTKKKIYLKINLKEILKQKYGNQNKNLLSTE